jgi:cardiolipin synthase (CMP-forming)
MAEPAGTSQGEHAAHGGPATDHEDPAGAVRPDGAVECTIIELAEKGLLRKGTRLRTLGQAVRFGLARAAAIRSRQLAFVGWIVFAFAVAAWILSVMHRYLAPASWWIAVGLTLLWSALMVPFSYIHLDLVRREDGRAWRSFLIPNGMTMTRLVMAPLVGIASAFAFALRPEGDAVLWPLVCVVASDLADGQIARFCKLKSEWGRLADPASDIYLACWFAAGLWWGGLLPAWLALVIVFRYAGTLAGVFIAWGVGRSVKILPTWPGRAANLCVDIYLPFLLAGALRFPGWLGSVWHVWLFRLVAVLVVVNIVYFFWKLARWLRSQKAAPATAAR